MKKYNTIHKGDVYRKYIFDEMARTTKLDIKELEKYVDSLNDSKAKYLCKKCSHSRRNGVYDFISKGPEHWLIKTITISKIYVIAINSKVNNYLSRNGWSLKRISKDKDIPKHREFKKYGNIQNRSLSLIAHRVATGRYRLIDGNHRAIKMACSGRKEFDLIFYR